LGGESKNYSLLNRSCQKGQHSKRAQREKVVRLPPRLVSISQICSARGNERTNAGRAQKTNKGGVYLWSVTANPREKHQRTNIGMPKGGIWGKTKNTENLGDLQESGKGEHTKPWREASQRTSQTLQGQRRKKACCGSLDVPNHSAPEWLDIMLGRKRQQERGTKGREVESVVGKRRGPRVASSRRRTKDTINCMGEQQRAFQRLAPPKRFSGIATRRERRPGAKVYGGSSVA